MSVATLHPAARRRIAPMLPPEPDHDVLLRPLGGGDAKTIIATSEARKFVEALFEDLGAADWQARLAAMRGKRRDPDGLLKLSLPVHRRFQLALFEAVCRQPGMPRLDPSKIASSGLVVRRYRGGKWAGWMKQGKRVSGWLPIALADADPDPVHRQAAHPANRDARALIAKSKPPSLLGEETIPLHLPPPEVCAALKRTVLFAVIPVASDDRSDEPPPALDYSALPAPQRADMELHLSEYLKQRPKLALPNAGEALSRDWNVLGRPTADPDWPRLNALGIFLQQMLVELDAEGTGPAPRALMALLRQIVLPTRRDAQGHVTASIDAAAFILKAAPILVGGEANPSGFAMPLEWPRVDQAMGARLTRAALDCLSARHAQVASSPGKYETLSDQYAVRGFIRIAGHDGCPDRLVWSGFSERFRIAAWWDGDGSGTKITLPDMSQLKKVKPNVSFEMPPAIANLLKGDMKKLADGEGSEDDTKGLELGWLCSFSIPIITLCAFIVLNIFLSLFDLIFRWMLFLKICIPIPKKAD
ncbi:MAG TPA: hypothetical protein VF574_04505 [Allosphingosinicella sp.]